MVWYQAALVICKKGKRRIQLREGKCRKKGKQLPTSDLGIVGPDGTPGPAGTDGQLRIYGDGSAGAAVITGTIGADDMGTLSVAGGAPGSQAPPSGTTVHGGGGGGASGGSGGAGGGRAGNTVLPLPQGGEDGHALVTLADPTALF